jgi:cytochrome c-type biogenesis protein CcmH
MKKLLLIMIVVLFTTMPTFAADDFYHFDNSVEQQRFEALIAQLRCLVCQNQTLAESNAPLAEDLRKQIYLKITHGVSDIEIIDYLVTRYGNFILYNPPLNNQTMALWFAPALLLIAGIAFLIYYLRKHREKSHAINF